MYTGQVSFLFLWKWLNSNIGCAPARNLAELMQWKIHNEIYFLQELED